ncbi:PH domain-containing protein [Dongia sp. agr-C8]
MARGKKTLPKFRIIPRKLGAAFNTLFFGMFLVMFATSLFAEFDSVTVNGREVYGEERVQALRDMNFMFLLAMIPMLLLFLFYARRLLPGSPLDFIEIGPAGLTTRGLLGRRHRRWEEITGFSAGRFFLSNPPIDWIKVESDRPLRFTLGGYLRFKFFSFGKAEAQAVAHWLEMVRGAFVFGGDSLPAMPEELAGKIINLSDAEEGPPRGRSSARSSVIER